MTYTACPILVVYDSSELGRNIIFINFTDVTFCYRFRALRLQGIHSGFFDLQNTVELKCSNSFGTIKICSRPGRFELMSVNHSARSRGITGISFRFSA